MRLCRGADLTMGAPEADSAEPQSSMLTVFEELKETPVGVVIYDQISQLLSDEEAAQRHIQRVYGMLLRLLLDAYASDPSLAHVNSINTKLNELRHALEAAGGVLSPAPSLTTPEEEPAPTSMGGLLGGFAKKLGKKKSQPTAEASPNRKQVMRMTSELLSVSTTVAPGAVQIPSGFKEKK